jgi:hypothetical protein
MDEMQHACLSVCLWTEEIKLASFSPERHNGVCVSLGLWRLRTIDNSTRASLSHSPFLNAHFLFRLHLIVFTLSAWKKRDPTS